MTLKELIKIQTALQYAKYVDAYLDEVEEALTIINREIALKQIANETVKKG